MYTRSPFKAVHLQQFEIHESQSFKHDGLTVEQCLDAYQQAEKMNNFTEPRTLMFDGKPICCCGLLELTPWRGEVWAIMAKNAGNHMKRIHTLATDMIEEAQGKVRRLEAYVDVDFKAGHRWVKMLGFKAEGIHIAYNPNGSDVMSYGRVS